MGIIYFFIGLMLCFITCCWYNNIYLKRDKRTKLQREKDAIYDLVCNHDNLEESDYDGI